MKLQLTIELSLPKHVKKQDVLSQLIPAIQKFEETFSRGARAELTHINITSNDEKESFIQPSPQTIEVGAVHINCLDRSVKILGIETHMTPIEFKLLSALATRRGAVQSHDILLKEVWNVNPENNTRTLSAHIKRLRDKLGPTNNIIHTIPGVGYIIR
jgi:DNA-binding response OmpR family regulator